MLYLTKGFKRILTKPYPLLAINMQKHGSTIHLYTINTWIMGSAY